MCKKNIFNFTQKCFKLQRCISPNRTENVKCLFNCLFFVCLFVCLLLLLFFVVVFSHGKHFYKTDFLKTRLIRMILDYLTPTHINVII